MRIGINRDIHRGELDARLECERRREKNPSTVCLCTSYVAVCIILLEDASKAEACHFFRCLKTADAVQKCILCTERNVKGVSTRDGGGEVYKNEACPKPFPPPFFRLKSRARFAPVRNKLAGVKKKHRLLKSRRLPHDSLKICNHVISMGAARGLTDGQ